MIFSLTSSFSNCFQYSRVNTYTYNGEKGYYLKTGSFLIRSGKAVFGREKAYEAATAELKL